MLLLTARHLSSPPPHQRDLLCSTRSLTRFLTRAHASASTHTHTSVFYTRTHTHFGALKTQARVRWEDEEAQWRGGRENDDNDRQPVVFLWFPCPSPLGKFSLRSAESFSTKLTPRWARRRRLNCRDICSAVASTIVLHLAAALWLRYAIFFETRMLFLFLYPCCWSVFPRAPSSRAVSLTHSRVSVSTELPRCVHTKGKLKLK